MKNALSISIRKKDAMFYGLQATAQVVIAIIFSTMTAPASFLCPLIVMLSKLLAGYFGALSVYNLIRTKI